MISKAVPHLLLFAAAAVLPGTVRAQQAVSPTAHAVRGGAAAQPDTAQLAHWLRELSGIHARLEQAQTEALRDAELVRQQDALGERIRAAMEEADPSLELGFARIEELEAEAARAREQGNADRLERAAVEARQIQQQFYAVQQQTLRQPAIAEALEAFQANLESRMVEVEPATRELIARMQQLEQLLSRAAERR